MESARVWNGFEKTAGLLHEINIMILPQFCRHFMSAMDMLCFHCR